jgi:uncharacterized protein (TIGR02217 family)
MSTQVFPTLTGLGFDVVRTPRWNNTTQRAVSGKTVRVAYWSYPIWTWELKFEFLRGDTTNREFQNLASLFNTVRGSYDSFLYTDADDKSVTNQAIGAGAGATYSFQLIRTMIGVDFTFSEPIYAPNVVSAVYVNSVLKTVVTDYSVSGWGSATPGVVTFVVPPSGTVTVDMTYYWPCHFLDDAMTFTKFMNQLWRGDKVKFESIR